MPVLSPCRCRSALRPRPTRSRRREEADTRGSAPFLASSATNAPRGQARAHSLFPIPWFMISDFSPGGLPPIDTVREPSSVVPAQREAPPPGELVLPPRAVARAPDSIRRDCLKNNWSPATRDFVRGRGGETGASPQRAVTVEPTKASRKRPVARRVFAEKALWLRCSSVTDRWRVCSLVAPRHRAFSAKTGPHLFFRQSLRKR